MGLFDQNQQLWSEFRLMDANRSVRTLPDQIIDLTVTDPAYESLERHRKKGTTTRLKDSKSSSNEWFPTISNRAMVLFFQQLYRVHKPRTHAYIMCDEATCEVYKCLARNAGWWVWKSLVWVKTKADGSPRIGMGYHWRNCTERILMLEKRTRVQVSQGAWTVHVDPTGSGRKLNNLGLGDVLQFPPVRSQDAYPTEKPVELLMELILNSSDEGERVYDPFVGSGATASAARACKREWTVSDISEASEARYRERIKD